jgi:hypothetical protein
LNPRSTPESGGRSARAATALALAAVACSVALVSPAALAEVAQKGPVLVSVSGKMVPQSLPRNGEAPVAVSIGGEIDPTEGEVPPQLRRITIAINRHGRLRTRGLPLCRLHQIQPSTSEEALKACRSALVGEGHFAADVQFPTQSPFPSNGEILAFNGRVGGKPAILAHIYGTKPLPTSYVLPFLIHRSNGTFGTVLEASLPEVTGDWGFVTGVDMTLWRRFGFRGVRESYLSAGCPAPAGFRSAFFALARTSFAFDGGITLTSLLTRRCTVSE